MLSLILAIGGIVGLLAVLAVVTLMLVGALRGCQYSFTFSLAHTPETYPLALPDFRSRQAYATLAWYPLTTLALAHCQQCGQAYEDDSTFFCGYCGTPSDALTEVTH